MTMIILMIDKRVGSRWQTDSKRIYIASNNIITWPQHNVFVTLNTQMAINEVMECSTLKPHSSCCLLLILYKAVQDISNDKAANFKRCSLQDFKNWQYYLIFNAALSESYAMWTVSSEQVGFCFQFFSLFFGSVWQIKLTGSQLLGWAHVNKPIAYRIV